ncbi:AtuA-related protein [Amycolatopsis sp.]|uniref:AtuA-related protein n=1 Tax=Amycolatopsis sp. TaxID=37632 RepID=UPI003BB89509
MSCPGWTHADTQDRLGRRLRRRSPRAVRGAGRARRSRLSRQHVADIVRGEVERHELPQLSALKVLLRNALSGVTRTPELDVHGKSLASSLLEMAQPEPPRHAARTSSMDWRTHDDTIDAAGDDRPVRGGGWPHTRQAIGLSRSARSVLRL